MIYYDMTHSLTRSLTHSRTHALTHSLPYSLPHSLTHPLTHSPTHPLTSGISPTAARETSTIATCSVRACRTAQAGQVHMHPSRRRRGSWVRASRASRASNSANTSQYVFFLMFCVFFKKVPPPPSSAPCSSYPPPARLLGGDIYRPYTSIWNHPMVCSRLRSPRDVRFLRGSKASG